MCADSKLIMYFVQTIVNYLVICTNTILNYLIMGANSRNNYLVTCAEYYCNVCRQLT